MFKPRRNSPCRLDNRVTSWRRFNHELRQLSEQVNRYHDTSNAHTHKLSSPHFQRYY